MFNIKKSFYELLNPEKDRSDFLGLFLMVSIILSVIMTVLETASELHTPFMSLVFYQSELFLSLVFLYEYGLRLWTITLNKKYGHWFWGRLDYATTPMMIIDFLSILPFILSFMGVGMVMVQLLRIFRIFRLFKLIRYTSGFEFLARSFTDNKIHLTISTIIMGSLLLISSTLMYLVEHRVQPESFSSIPSTMWWGVATLTTVGYGDMYPVTITGKILGSIIFILGVGLFGIPTAILAGSFVHYLNENKTTPTETEDIESVGLWLYLDPSDPRIKDRYLIYHQILANSQEVLEVVKLVMAKTPYQIICHTQDLKLPSSPLEIEKINLELDSKLKEVKNTIISA